MKHKPIIIGLTVLAAVLSVRGYLVLSKIDRSSPVITFPNNSITYIDGEDYSELLSGVKAIDQHDGDVSNSLIVEKVYADESAKQAVITYAAVDYSNNLMKMNRVVEYRPSESDNEEQSDASEQTNAPEQTDIPEETNSPDQTNAPGQTDDPEEADASIQTLKPSQTLTPSQSSMVLGKAPVVYLKTKTIIIQQNGKFSAKDFVAHIIDDKDSEKSLLKKIKMIGSYNNQKKGSYEMNLYVEDSDGNTSNVESVTLIVE